MLENTLPHFQKDDEQENNELCTSETGQGSHCVTYLAQANSYLFYTPPTSHGHKCLIY